MFRCIADSRNQACGITWRSFWMNRRQGTSNKHPNYAEMTAHESRHNKEAICHRRMVAQAYIRKRLRRSVDGGNTPEHRKVAQATGQHFHHAYFVP